MRVIRPVNDEELFDHQVTAWTAGELRSALEGCRTTCPSASCLPTSPAAISSAMSRS
jgi:hypothetical protein